MNVKREAKLVSLTFYTYNISKILLKSKEIAFSTNMDSAWTQPEPKPLQFNKIELLTFWTVSMSPYPGLFVGVTSIFNY